MTRPVDWAAEERKLQSVFGAYLSSPSDLLQC